MKVIKLILAIDKSGFFELVERNKNMLTGVYQPNNSNDQSNLTSSNVLTSCLPSNVTSFKCPTFNGNKNTPLTGINHLSNYNVSDNDSCKLYRYIENAKNSNCDFNNFYQKYQKCLNNTSNSQNGNKSSCQNNYQDFKCQAYYDIFKAFIEILRDSPNKFNSCESSGKDNILNNILGSENKVLTPIVPLTNTVIKEIVTKVDEKPPVITITKVEPHETKVKDCESKDENKNNVTIKVKDCNSSSSSEVKTVTVSSTQPQIQTVTVAIPQPTITQNPNINSLSNSLQFGYNQSNNTPISCLNYQQRIQQLTAQQEIQQICQNMMGYQNNTFKPESYVDHIIMPNKEIKKKSKDIDDTSDNDESEDKPKSKSKSTSKKGKPETKTTTKSITKVITKEPKISKSTRTITKTTTKIKKQTVSTSTDSTYLNPIQTVTTASVTTNKPVDNIDNTVLHSIKDLLHELIAVKTSKCLKRIQMI
ncbi:hypothetical protein A0H76_2372 [Hepatospora eriocheir]|uniref:Uncharacterized protein n=1 Tax=Hepatospora eriocheir TaxID=1081669 RepID=A0A1X0QFI3_9MICR|nr:hypothetical protein A0H76_2372 [Hepatospora eriocheir]